jgi:hypothetical protein
MNAKKRETKKRESKLCCGARPPRLRLVIAGGVSLPMQAKIGLAWSAGPRATNSLSLNF